MRRRSAAITGSRSTSACAPAAQGFGICSPAMSSSATRATASFGMRARRSTSPSAPSRRWPSSIRPIRRSRPRSSVEREPARPFARRVDLLRLAESGKRTLVFVSHPWGGGIRRYMNDLVALTERPLRGAVPRARRGRHGEAVVAAARRRASRCTSRCLPSCRCWRARCARSASSACTSTTCICSRRRSWSLPAAARRALRLHAARLPPDLPAVPPRHRGRPVLRRARCGAAARRASRKRPAQWGLDITTWRGAFAPAAARGASA